ncbi:unnamed protein product, partial [marine sediment metagenome]
FYLFFFYKVTVIDYDLSLFKVLFFENVGK